MKKNLKKVAFLLVATIVMGAFTACGGADSASSEEGTTVASVEETTTEETTEAFEDEEINADETEADKEEIIEVSEYIGDDDNIYVLTSEQMVVTDTEKNVLATLTVTSGEDGALALSNDETGEVYGISEATEDGTVVMTNEAGEAVVLTPVVTVE